MLKQILTSMFRSKNLFVAVAGVVMVGAGASWLYHRFAKPLPSIPVPKFSSEQMAVLTKLFSAQPEEIIVQCKPAGTQCGAGALTGHDIQTLRSDQWLNDEVINFYIGLLAEAGDHSVFRGSHFFATLKQHGPARVRRESEKNIQTFADVQVLMPIHVGTNHWCLGVIDLKQKRLAYYDSLRGSGHDFFNHIKKFLKHEAEFRPELKGENFDEWTLDCPKDIPHQNNGVDCGVFTLLYAKALSQHKGFNFEQKDIPDARKQIALECHARRLLPIS